MTDWYCKTCGRSGTTNPETVIVYHDCRPERNGKRVVPLEQLDGTFDFDQLDTIRTQWFLTNYPTPGPLHPERKRNK